MTKPVSHEGWQVSCNITEVDPVLAAEGRLAHHTEPLAESLETDLGTYADKTQLLWMLLASQVSRGASRDVATEHRDAAVQWG